MATGQPIGDLLAGDSAVVAALAELHEERWSRAEEMLALNAELLHLLYRSMLRLWGDKGTQLPAPLEIRRPGREPASVGMGAMARRLVGAKSEEVT